MLEGARDLGVGLVVAVEDHTRRFDPSPEDRVQLATAGDIEAQAFVGDEASHRCAQERLGRVCRAVAEGRRRLPTSGSKVLLVVDEQGRAMCTCQIDDVASTDRQVAIGPNRGRRRQQVMSDRVGRVCGRAAHGHKRRVSPLASPAASADPSSETPEGRRRAGCRGLR